MEIAIDVGVLWCTPGYPIKFFLLNIYSIPVITFITGTHGEEKKNIFTPGFTKK